MKTEKILKGLIVVLSVTLLIFIGLIYNINNSEKDKLEKTYFYHKSYGEWIDDEWYYFFQNISLDGKKVDTHFYDGCNLKHSTLDDYGVQIKNENGEIVEIMEDIPSLSISQKYTNNQREGLEIVLIDEFFDKNKYNDVIIEEDLEDLKVYNIDKDILLRIFNKSIQQKFDNSMGKYIMGTCEYKTEEFKDGYKWNIGLVTMSGYIKAIRLDIIYSDGSYLSDLVKENKADKHQKEIFNNFDKIEEYIVNEQKTDAMNEYIELQGKEYIRLQTILDSLDDFEL